MCNGQLLPIAQNQALFSLLGTTYGGDGIRTFALPDLRGRMPIHMHGGPGLSNYVLGESYGYETTTIRVNNLPPHNHVLTAFSEEGDTAAPQGALLASTGATDMEYRASGTTVAMAPQAVGVTGGNQPVDLRQPYLALNYQIAIQGMFPSRD